MQAAPRRARAGEAELRVDAIPTRRMDELQRDVFAAVEKGATLRRRPHARRRAAALPDGTQARPRPPAPLERILVLLSGAHQPPVRRASEVAMMTNDDRLTRAIVTGNLARRTPLRPLGRGRRETPKRGERPPSSSQSSTCSPTSFATYYGRSRSRTLAIRLDGRTPLHRAVDVECADAKHREDTDGVAYAPEPTLTLISSSTAAIHGLPPRTGRRPSTLRAARTTRKRPGSSGRAQTADSPDRTTSTAVSSLARATARRLDLIPDRDTARRRAAHCEARSRAGGATLLIAFDSDADAFPRAHARGLWDRQRARRERPQTRAIHRALAPVCPRRVPGARSKALRRAWEVAA